MHPKFQPYICGKLCTRFHLHFASRYNMWWAPCQQKCVSMSARTKKYVSEYKTATFNNSVGIHPTWLKFCIVMQHVTYNLSTNCWCRYLHKQQSRQNIPLYCPSHEPTELQCKMSINKEKVHLFSRNPPVLPFPRLSPIKKYHLMEIDRHTSQSTKVYRTMWKTRKITKKNC